MHVLEGGHNGVLPQVDQSEGVVTRTAQQQVTVCMHTQAHAYKRNKIMYTKGKKVSILNPHNK